MDNNKPSVVPIPKPQPMTQEGRIRYAIECSFDEFRNVLKRLGVPLNPVMGFVYMPNDVKEPFKYGCLKIVEYLKPKTRDAA